jgi:hypothetical protein
MKATEAYASARRKFKPDVVVHTCNSSTQEAEAGGQ